MGIGAVLAGAILCGLFLLSRHGLAGGETVLDGVVVEETRAIVAGSTGALHRNSTVGARLEAGAMLATISPAQPAPPPPVSAATLRRLKDSLYLANLVLTRARKQQATLEELFHQERATRAEMEEAGQEVHSRQSDRDRAQEALAQAANPPRVDLPPPHAVVVDGPLLVKTLEIEEGATVTAGQTIATVVSPETRVEAPLGKAPAPEEGASVLVRVAGADLPGRITAIHVEGATRTVTVGLDPATPIAPGTHLPVRILRDGS